MRESRRVKTVAAVVAALLVLFVVLSPVLLRGEVPSIVELLVLSSGSLGVGLMMRLRGSAGARTLGSILVIIGVVSLAIVVGLTWLLLQGWGRPY